MRGVEDEVSEGETAVALRHRPDEAGQVAHTVEGAEWVSSNSARAAQGRSGGGAGR